MTYTQKSTQLSFHSSKKTFGKSISKHIIWSFPLCQPSFWAPLFPGGTLWCHSLRWPGSSWLPLGSLGGMVRQPPGNVELGKLLGNSKDPKKKNLEKSENYHLRITHIGLLVFFGWKKSTLDVFLAPSCSAVILCFLKMRIDGSTIVHSRSSCIFEFRI